MHTVVTLQTQFAFKKKEQTCSLFEVSVSYFPPVIVYRATISLGRGWGSLPVGLLAS